MGSIFSAYGLVLGAEQWPQREVAAALAAELKIGADPDLGHPPPFRPARCARRSRLPLRHLARETHDRRALDAGARSTSSFCVLVIGDAGALSGRRMRGGVADGTFGATLVRPTLEGAALDALDNLDVGHEMQSVEVAESADAGKRHAHRSSGWSLRPRGSGLNRQLQSIIGGARRRQAAPGWWRRVAGRDRCA